MNFGGHLFLGLLTFLALTWATATYEVLRFLHPGDSGIALLALLATLYGSIAPDLDIRSSKVYAITTAAVVAGSISVIFLTRIEPLWIALFLIGYLALSLIPKHRGRFHSPPAAAVYGGLLFLIFRNPTIALFGVAGYLSHILVGDFRWFKRRHRAGFV